MKTFITSESLSCGAPAQAALAELPVRAGASLKPDHFQTILNRLPDIGFFEIHAENYLVDGGPFHHYLTRIRERYALSIHGVGLSIGGESPLDQQHLDRLADLIDRYAPAVFSEHLAWSGHAGFFLNDLLPLPYHRATLQRVCDHVDQVQNRLKRRLLLENPATYVEFSSSTITETDFIIEILQRTGCGLLLDINNVYVSSTNHNRDPRAYIDALPPGAVGQIHLAGFSQEQDGAGAPLLIDSHDAPVAAAVWDLYDYALCRFGPVPTLIERDGNIPPFEVLQAEVRQADERLNSDALRGGQS